MGQVIEINAFLDRKVNQSRTAWNAVLAKSEAFEAKGLSGFATTVAKGAIPLRERLDAMTEKSRRYRMAANKANGITMVENVVLTSRPAAAAFLDPSEVVPGHIDISTNF